jgi:uncharacterized SAM-binding protein YcdF (DUF218 family)
MVALTAHLDLKCDHDLSPQNSTRSCLSSFFLLIVLIAFSIWLKQRRYAVLAIVALWVMSMPIVSDLANANLERGMIRLDALDIDQADAIIVLSGMLTTVPARQNGELTLITEWGDPDRFFGGVELFKAGKAPRLIFTRGQVPWMKNSIPEGEYLKSTVIELGIAKSAILITDIVTNTQEEAVASKALFDNAALKLNLKIVASPKIILVTSAFHMPRAQVMFDPVEKPSYFKNHTAGSHFDMLKAQEAAAENGVIA